MRLWDISEPIEPASATFPGDSPFAQEWVARQEQGASCNVSTIRMSVHVGTRATGQWITGVPPGAFHPPPKVMSGVVRFDLRREAEVGPAGPEGFERVVRAAFAQRRKTIANSLATTVVTPRVARSTT